MATQTKEAKLYRAGHWTEEKVSPEKVDAYIHDNPTARVHRSKGQVFRIDLPEKHHRSFASQTIYGQLAGDNSHCQHIGNRNLFR
jgi:hypothetical protein